MNPLKQTNSPSAESTALGAALSSLGRAAPEGYYCEGYMADPAVNFYPENFLAGTMFFTDEQAGRYIRALCAQQIHGHLSLEQLDNVVKGDTGVKKKFVQDENGLYYNVRMEKEIEKRKKYTASRLKNLNPHTEPHMEPHMESPYGNPICETETETEIDTKKATEKEGVVKKGKGYSEDDLLKIATVVRKLNAICHTSFRNTSKATRKHIHARIHEGFHLKDFVAVIEFKNEEWGGDPKMCQYLRPETLFGTKFESYLQAARKSNDDDTPSVRFE